MKWLSSRSQQQHQHSQVWRSIWYRGLWLIPVLAVIGVSLSRCQRAAVTLDAIQPLPQDSLIQVYMNHSQAHRYREPYRPIERSGQDLEAVTVAAIRNAKTSIDVAVQEFRLPRIAQALVERRRAGVQVRVVMENIYTRPWSSLTTAEQAQLDPRLQQRYRDWQLLVDANADGQITPPELQNRDVLTILNQGQIPWLDDTADGSKGSRLMHHKFLVVDGQTVVATSANFTPSDVHGDLQVPDTRGNANALLVIRSPALAKLFTQEFSYLWGDGPGAKPDSRFGVNKPFRPVQWLQIGQSRVAIKFSPSSSQVPWDQTTNGLIAEVLNSARRQVNLALFVFSDQQVANYLARLRRRGTQLRVLVDPEFIYRSYSEALDLMGVQIPVLSRAEQLGGQCTYEAANQPWAPPLTTVGAPNLPRGDKLHHKFAELDDRTVILGSHNWSESGNLGNDEFLLVIEQPLVAAHFAREFERLYNNSQLGPPTWLKNRIAQQLKDCRQIHPASAPPAQPTTTGGTPTALPAQIQTRINLNTATQAELESLPGVGPKLAQGIIAFRQQQTFRSLQDLDAVPGIGPALLVKLAERVTW